MNKIMITGYVEEVCYSHEMYGEKFYAYIISIKRLSGIEDFIRVIVSERIIDISSEDEGKHAVVSGEFRSYNDDGHLILYVFAENLYFDKNAKDENTLLVEGFICKKPVMRITPAERKITDILLAVNRKCGRTDYLPCIAWGRNAMYSKNLNIGDKVSINGRVQSRDYNKNNTIHTINEVSVIQILTV